MEKASCVRGAVRIVVVILQSLIIIYSYMVFRTIRFSHQDIQEDKGNQISPHG